MGGHGGLKCLALPVQRKPWLARAIGPAEHAQSPLGAQETLEPSEHAHFLQESGSLVPQGKDCLLGQVPPPQCMSALLETHLLQISMFRPTPGGANGNLRDPPLRLSYLPKRPSPTEGPQGVPQTVPWGAGWVPQAGAEGQRPASGPRLLTALCKPLPGQLPLRPADLDF